MSYDLSCQRHTPALLRTSVQHLGHVCAHPQPCGKKAVHCPTASASENRFDARPQGDAAPKRCFDTAQHGRFKPMKSMTQGTPSLVLMFSRSATFEGRACRWRTTLSAAPDSDGSGIGDQEPVSRQGRHAAHLNAQILIGYHKARMPGEQAHSQLHQACCHAFAGKRGTHRPGRDTGAR